MRNGVQVKMRDFLRVKEEVYHDLNRQPFESVTKAANRLFSNQSVRGIQERSGVGSNSNVYLGKENKKKILIVIVFLTAFMRSDGGMNTKKRGKSLLT